MVRPRLSFPIVGLVLANALIPIALLVFAKGFFPYKPFIPGFAHRSESIVTSKAPFDRVIFMVVDALRSDFVYSRESGFEFTQSLIRDGSAIPFTAHATSPTITMPRVKAITTGSIPSFLDVILNFAESDTSSTLADQDSWLAQMKLKKDGKKLVMYGDDTWLKLFPRTFDRSDGTSSFFVSDFTEVDNNVTRHLPEELQRDDWNTMIMHYLGLDHIGHKAGPRSPHMKPKQREMDDVVRLIYLSMTSQAHLNDTLLVLCGDHGMNDAGNHGGSSPGETSPALVFLSPKFKTLPEAGAPCPDEPKEAELQYYDTVEQSDIAPTLASLLGFPIPRNNLGVLIPQLLSFWSESDKVRLMRDNAHQIYRIVEATFPISSSSEHPRDCSAATSDGKELHCRWEQASRASSGEDVSLAILSQFCKRAQQILSSAASNYDLSYLNCGILLSAISLSISLLFYVPKTLLRSSKTSAQKTATIVLLTSLSYAFMSFASSYVEEEQHFWYWGTSLFLLYLLLRSFRHLTTTSLPSALRQTFAPLLLLSLHRLTTRLNQTGQKHTSSPSIAGTFFLSNSAILLILVLTTYLSLFRRVLLRCFPPSFPSTLRFILSTTTVLSSLAFKISFVNADAPEILNSLSLPPSLANLLVHASTPLMLINQARTVFLALGLTYSLSLLFSPTPKGRTVPQPPKWLAHDLLTLLLVTQTRFTNVPVYLIFEMQLSLLIGLIPRLDATSVSLTGLLAGRTAFFAMGGSNAISSVDLSSAYNGVGGYNVFAVGLLTFVSNWAGAIWWVSATSILLLQADGPEPISQQERGEKETKLVHEPSHGGPKSERLAVHLNSTGPRGIWTQHVAAQTLFVSAGTTGVMGACAVLRQHLFVWTVFSPKYLYAVAWGLGFHLITSLGFGSVLHWIGGGWD